MLRSGDFYLITNYFKAIYVVYFESLLLLNYQLDSLYCDFNPFKDEAQTALFKNPVLTAL